MLYPKRTISSYKDRHLRISNKSSRNIIKKQKRRVNKLFARLIKKVDTMNHKSLIVDSFDEQTRNILKLRGNVPNSNIVTVDLECQSPDSLHHKLELKEHLNSTSEMYTNIFADVISSPKYSIEQVRPIFERKRLQKGGIFAITMCTRRTNSRKFGSFYPTFHKLALKNGYYLQPIDVPQKLQLGTRNTYNIRTDTTDNGGLEKTGRTMTAFYYVS